MFFLYLLLNIDCWYSLEPPHWGGSSVYPQSMLSAKIRKLFFFLSKKFQFYCREKSLYIAWTCFRNDFAGYEDNYKCLDGFKFRQNSTADFRVSCPWASEKKTRYNLVSTLASQFLIGSSSFLQVWRTAIISRTISKYGRIWPRTAELATLERLKKTPIDLWWGKSCKHSRAFIFYSCR